MCSLFAEEVPRVEYPFALMGFPSISVSNHGNDSVIKRSTHCHLGSLMLGSPQFRWRGSNHVQEAFDGGALAVSVSATSSFAAHQYYLVARHGGRNGEVINEVAQKFNAAQSECALTPTSKVPMKSPGRRIAAFRSGQQPNILQVFRRRCRHDHQCQGRGHSGGRPIHQGRLQILTAMPSSKA